jgi:Protein of unknown function (DUF3455)
MLSFGVGMLLTLALAAQSPDAPALPEAAKAIEVTPSASVRLKFHFVAAGKQIYRCENGAWPGGSAPDATLFDMNATRKIHHGAGPSWTTLDGNSTVRANGATAVHFRSPDGVSIDWLKLDAERSSRTGEFADVGTIQRLYTGGGKAPSGGCTANQVFESPYTAHYFFWTAK